ncbi:MAG: hypothetical protein E6Q40_08910 [Cupriavidus sp.]|nr:MAG: hypothetical protein E6Q40_08910 [Cupriavidus sp.]
MNHNVTAIGAHPKLHPAGREMRHDELGWVAVLEARGNERLVRAFEIVDDPEPELMAGEDPDAILTAYRIYTQEVWVGVATLHVVRNADHERPERLRMTYRHGKIFAKPDEALSWESETSAQAEVRRARSRAARRPE